MKKLLLAGFAGLVSVAAAQAAPITSGTSLSVGGLTFSDFSCVTNSNGGTVAGGCSGLSVDSNGSNGIVFAGGLTAFGVPGQTGASNLDVLLGYQVSSSSPLSNVALGFNAFINGPGLATAEVIETIAASRSNPAVLASTSVSTVGSSNATLAFPAGLISAFLTKDIQLNAFAGSTLTTVSISSVTQTYPGGGTNPGTPIPEPMSLALLGAGLVGLGMVRRTKRS